MIYFIIVLFIAPLFLIRPNFISNSFSNKKMVGIPLFVISYTLLIFYFLPLIINSAPNLGIFENFITFVRYQSQIDYKIYFPIVFFSSLLFIVFFILGYLTPFKINNIYFFNYKNNLINILSFFSIFLFCLQVVSIISQGPAYFLGYNFTSSTGFASSLQLSIFAAEFIGVINALNWSLKKPNKISTIILFASLFLLSFRAKRLEILAMILPSFLAIQKRNLSKFKSKIKYLFFTIGAFFILAFVGALRIQDPSLNFLNLIYSVFTEPFLASQTFQGYLTINGGEPRFLFVNTLAAIISLIPAIIFPDKWEFLFSIGYYNNRDLNFNGANVILTGIYDDFGIFGIILFAFLFGCIVRYADKSRILTKEISYYNDNLNLQTIIYYLSPVIILHFRDGFANTLKYFIQSTIFILLIVLASSKFKFSIPNKSI